MTDEVPPGFDEDEATVIAMRHPETGAPTVIPRDVALEESRAYRAYSDWLGGKSWELIAAEHGYVDARAAQYDIKQYVESARSLYNSLTLHQARALQMARLEELLQSLWPQRTNVAANNAAADRISQMIKLMKLDQLDDDEADEGAQTVIVAGAEQDYIEALERASRD